MLRYRSFFGVCANSRRKPHILPSDPGQIATVLVAFAVIEGSPSQMSVGNETSVPPPATELIAPARNEAIQASAMRPGSKHLSLTAPDEPTADSFAARVSKR
jgi:hypothetical protein